MTFHVPLRYIERYFMYLIVYQKAPCVRLCIRQHYYQFELPRTLSLSGDPTRIPYHLIKSLCPSCLEPYTKKNIQGDYYACTLEVYREWHLLNNLGERPDYLNSSYHFKFACLTYNLSREIFWCVF